MVVGEGNSIKAKERGTSGGCAKIIHAQLQIANIFTHYIVQFSFSCQIKGD